MSQYRKAAVTGVIIPQKEFRAYGFEDDTIRDQFLEMVPTTPMYWEHENSSIGQWNYGMVTGGPGNHEIVVHGSVYAPAQVPASRRKLQATILDDLRQQKINGISVGMDCIVRASEGSPQTFSSIVLKEISLCNKGLFQGSKIIQVEASDESESEKKNQVTLVTSAAVIISDPPMDDQDNTQASTGTPPAHSAADLSTAPETGEEPRIPDEPATLKRPAGEARPEPVTPKEDNKRPRLADTPDVAQLTKDHEELLQRFSSNNLEQMKQVLGGVPNFDVAAHLDHLTKLCADTSKGAEGIRRLVHTLATQKPSGSKPTEAPLATWGPKIASNLTTKLAKEQTAPPPTGHTIQVAASSKTNATGAIVKTLVASTNHRVYGTDLAAALAGF